MSKCRVPELSRDIGHELGVAVAVAYCCHRLVRHRPGTGSTGQTRSQRNVSALFGRERKARHSGQRGLDGSVAHSIVSVPFPD